jgi:hypothetical protein
MNPTTERRRQTHPPLCVSRRELLQVGYSGLLGLGLSSFAKGDSRSSGTSARGPKAESVLLVFLTGGPGHLDTFDPKPDAPAEIRGGLGTIATKLPGVRFSELLPGLSARLDRFALIRTMALGSPGFAVHELATPLVLAGVDALPPGAGLAATRHDWPCYSAGLEAVRPRRDGLPSGVALPRPLNSYAGQNAGLLGPKYDPWQLDLDPLVPAFGPAHAGLPPGLAVRRVGDRRALLDQVDQWSRAADRLENDRFNDHQRRAFRLLDSGRLASAFALDREDPKLRDRYGRHIFGQTLLLARRLIQAGIPLVQANMGVTAQWDFHAKNEKNARRLAPPLDQAVSTLLDDLASSGLLERTLVVMLGEFGRTPRINPDAGRDHWTDAFCGLFAGAGVVPGQVIGKTDRIAAYPLSRTFSPADLGATIYEALGIDPSAEFHDVQGRPHQLDQGQLIAPLFA